MNKTGKRIGIALIVGSLLLGAMKSESASLAGKANEASENQQIIPAFPGAEGFGSLTVGGRGGKVLEVTNLNDSGPGSLRAAIDAEGPRTVVFRVGGTIELYSRIDIRNPYLTIAGQTAPGGGIAVKNNPSNIHSPLRISTHDVVIRYIRSRPGPSEKPSDVVDALTINDGDNIIIDHCSLSWATDEVVNTWLSSHDITIQWSIISEGLNKSTHPEGVHSMGMLIGSEDAENISIHHNLFAHNRHRNPKVNISGVADVVNNVIYNGRYAGEVEDSYAKPRLNFVGNYIKPGADSVYNYDFRYWNDMGHKPSLYIKGNISGFRPTNDLPEKLVVRKNDRKYITDQRHPVAEVTTTSAEEAFFEVLSFAGATLPMRDAVDLRIVKNVKNGTGNVINHPSEVGGWPELAAGEAALDSDHDGMADEWETANGLDATDPDDNNGDSDGDGYTNLEEYLNELTISE